MSRAKPKPAPFPPVPASASVCLAADLPPLLQILDAQYR